MTTAAYIRVSTEHQDHDSQVHSIQTYHSTQCSGNYVSYIDTGSGSTMTRPKVQELLADIRKGKVTRVIVYELSRLSRNMFDIHECLQTFSQHNVQFHSVSDGGLQDLGGAVNQFIQLTRGLTAQLERERISARTKAGLAAARARGVRLGPPAGARNRLGKFKAYPPEVLKQMHVLRDSGQTYQQIGLAMGFSKSKVVRMFRRNQRLTKKA